MSATEIHYTPRDFGLDSIPSFRQVQLEALDWAAYLDKRFAAAVLPGGSGKSVFAISLAKLTNLRTVILTETKGLQSQYISELGKAGLVDIRGKANYPCGDYENLDCRAGQSLGCSFIGAGCNYEHAKSRARNSNIVVTSYAYWLNVNDKAQGLERTQKDAELFGENPVEMLICDEAHHSPDSLSDYLHCTLYEKEVERLGEHPNSDNIEQWKKFVQAHSVELAAEIRTTQMELSHLGRRATQEHVKVLHQLESLWTKFERINGMEEKEWVCDKREGTKWGRIWAFDVIWPGRYAEQYLFCHVPKVVVMSATLRKKTMALLGVRKEDYEFREWRRTFPANRNPIFLIPAKRADGTIVRMSHKMNEADKELVIELADEIIKDRLDRKGLIQSVSYDLQRFITEHSGHNRWMLGNTDEPDSPNATEVADKFRKAKPPSILVSPSFSTGWNFSGVQCEYIIMPKIPFVPRQGKVMRAREERDEEYGPYLAIQTFVQAALRGMRFELDRCEVFCLDGQGNWFLYRYAHLAPMGFVKGIRRVDRIPKPPEKLT